MQISDIFHNCPEEEQQEQQCNPKDLGSKFPWSKIRDYILMVSEKREKNQRILVKISIISYNKRQRAYPLQVGNNTHHSLFSDAQIFWTYAFLKHVRECQQICIQGMPLRNDKKNS